MSKRRFTEQLEYMLLGACGGCVDDALLGPDDSPGLVACIGMEAFSRWLTAVESVFNWGRAAYVFEPHNLCKFDYWQQAVDFLWECLPDDANDEV